MKYICLLILFISACSAPNVIVKDKQWLIKENGTLYRQGLNYNTVTPNSTGVTLEGFKHSEDIMLTDGTILTGRNDLFIIYNNNHHFNSYQMQNWYDRDPNYIPISYTLNTNNIAYLYYTNVYEEDDPVEENSTNPGRITGVKDLTTTMTTSNLSANHSIVEGKDVTIIIKNSQEGCGKLNLCYQINGTAVDTTGLRLRQSPIFNVNGNATSMLGLTANSINGNCINNIEIDAYAPYGYINFRAPDNIPNSYMNQYMNISLTSENGNCNENIDLIISDAHDPNYVKVLCVAQDGNKSYVKYRIHVHNDGEAPADNLSLEMNLPNGAIINDINETNIFYAQVAGTDVTNDVAIKNYGNTITFNTGNSLPIMGTAFIDFCVPFASKINLSIANLIPSGANSIFVEDYYSIETFYDLVDTCAINPASRPIPSINEDDAVNSFNNHMNNSNVIPKSKGRIRASTFPPKPNKRRKCPRPISTPSECSCQRTTIYPAEPEKQE